MHSAFSAMFIWHLVLTSLGVCWANAQVAPGAFLEVNVPLAVPSGASGSIDKGFPGFGIAVHAFAYYAGNTSSPNAFSKNLISNIANRTGAQVRIRVGGTSGDTAKYDPSLSTSIEFPPDAVPGGIPSGLKLGPTFFEGFASFDDVLWTYMAHFALNYSGAMQNSIEATQQALKYIGENLDALEIGNEVDLYPGKQRPKSWDVQDYIDQWSTYAQAITSQLLSNTSYAKGPIFQAPVYANHDAPWLIPNTFEKGINSNNDIKYSSLHYYQQGSNASDITLQRSFMNHTAIASNVSYFTGPISWLQQNQPNIPLVLGETNSDTYSMNNTAYIGVFGSALWQVDFMLYAAAIGVSHLSIQLSTGFAYTAWNPVEYYGSPPAVYPPYYASVFVADVIGNAGDVRISNIDLNLDQFSAYGVYDATSGALTKIALVNLVEWNTTTSYARPSTDVVIALSNDNATSTPWSEWPSLVQVQRLTAPGADSLNNITWAGAEFTYESNGMPVQVSPECEPVWSLGGWLPVSVRASEAVLISFT